MEEVSLRHCTQVLLAEQVRVKAHTFDVCTTLALIILALDLQVPFPTLLHSLILLRVIPPRLIPHFDLRLVLLVVRPHSASVDLISAESAVSPSRQQNM